RCRRSRRSARTPAGAPTSSRATCCSCRARPPSSPDLAIGAGCSMGRHNLTWGLKNVPKQGILGRRTMRTLAGQWPMIAVALLTSTAAFAGNLIVVEVGAPAVNCVYSPNCTITVTDSVGQLALQNLDTPNTAWLQSRTFTGMAGTPGAGKTGYEYR